MASVGATVSARTRSSSSLIRSGSTSSRSRAANPAAVRSASNSMAIETVVDGGLDPSPERLEEGEYSESRRRDGQGARLRGCRQGGFEGQTDACEGHHEHGGHHPVGDRARDDPIDLVQPIPEGSRLRSRGAESRPRSSR